MSFKRKIKGVKQTGRVKRGGLFAVANCLAIAAAITMFGTACGEHQGQSTGAGENDATAGKSQTGPAVTATNLGNASPAAAGTNAQASPGPVAPNALAGAGAQPATNTQPSGPEEGGPQVYVSVTNSEGQVSQASLHIQVDSQSKQDDGKFLTICPVKFDSQYPVPMLVVIAIGKSIEKAELSPKAGGRVLTVGGAMADSTGKRVGFGAGVKDAPGGDYVMKITSTNAEEFNFEWEIR